MDKLHELFLHELADTLDAEQQLTKALPQIEQETTDPNVRQRIAQHQEETRQQIKNLEACFESLSEKPRTEKCAGIAGILQEKQSALKEQPSKEILQVINLAGSSKVEHYEIASYTSLVGLARIMGHTDCERLLNENLQQEQAMATFLEEQAPIALDKIAEKTGDKNMEQQDRPRSRR